MHKFITYKTNKEIVNPVLSKKGDIIMPGSGESKYDISNSAVVPYNGIICGGDLIILRSKKEIDSLYFSYFITNKLKKQIHVETGIFGADMKVELINDGPVTIILESKR